MAIGAAISGIASGAAGSFDGVLANGKGGMISLTDGELLSFTVPGGSSFVFKLSTLPHQSYKRDTEYRWAQNDVFGKEPVLQWCGKGMETITLQGTVFPFYNQGYGLLRYITGNQGDMQVDNFREKFAENGKPGLLINGRGTVWGKYVIEKVSDSGSMFMPNGTPRKQEFDITFKKYSSNISDTEKQAYYYKAIGAQAVRIAARRLAVLTRKFELPSLAKYGL